MHRRVIVQHTSQLDITVREALRTYAHLANTSMSRVAEAALRAYLLLPAEGPAGPLPMQALSARGAQVRLPEPIQAKPAPMEVPVRRARTQHLAGVHRNV
jgi:hypothetical protein